MIVEDKKPKNGLRLLRRRAGMTTRQAAEASGFSAMYVSVMERMDRPPAEAAVRLATALGATRAEACWAAKACRECLGTGQAGLREVHAAKPKG